MTGPQIQYVMVRLCTKGSTFSVFQGTQNELCLCGNMTEISGSGVFRSDSVPVSFGDVGSGLNIILIK